MNLHTINTTHNNKTMPQHPTSQHLIPLSHHPKLYHHHLNILLCRLLVNSHLHLSVTPNPSVHPLLFISTRQSITRNSSRDIFFITMLRLPSVTCHFSKMKNRSEVITQRFIFSELPHRSFQKLPESPEPAECIMMYMLGTLWVLSGAPQCFWTSGTESKNILKSMKSSSECYEIIPLSSSVFGAAGTITLVSMMIPAHMDPDSPAVIIYNCHIERYNSINYLTAIHLNQAFWSKWYTVQ